jgi:uncharacterized phage protein gp47/JayE
MSSGLSDTGLEIETVDDIRSGMQSDLRDAFFKSLPVGDSDVLGHLVGMIANELGLLWERLEQVNSSQDPDKATGQPLDALSALTGTFRQPAVPSKATITLCGSPGATAAAGFVVQTASTQQNFDTVDTVVTVALTAWGTSTSYSVGDRVTANSRCYQCITSGLSSGIGTGPSSADPDIVDGTVHWEYIGEGTAAVDVEADCEVDGPTQATAGDLTVIQTPAAGISSARNLTDAILGALESSDEELRLIRQVELAGNGATTKDALRAEVLKVANVTSCTVFVNNTDTTDGNGLPPHSFETLVLGGLDQDVVDTIANDQPAGIATYGSSSGTHTDSQGTPSTIRFTRPTDINLYVDITLTYDATQYPSDGDVEVKDDIATWAQGYYVTGKDANPSIIGAQAFGVGGVLGVSQVLVYSDVIGTPTAWLPTTSYSATPGSRSVVTNDGGRTYICITAGTSAGSGGPTGIGTDIIDGGAHWYYLGNTFAITLRELAVLDTSRISVHSSAVVP